MKIKELASGTVCVIYAVIMLEGILMATPFALYLYSFYFPFLEGVQQSILVIILNNRKDGSKNNEGRDRPPFPNEYHLLVCRNLS